MTIRPIALLIAGAAAVSLTACGSSSSGQDDTPSAPPAASTPAPVASTPAPVASTPAPVASTPAVSTPAPVASSTAAGKPVAKAVNKSFNDPVLGEKATVLKVVRNYPVSAAIKKKYSALEDEEVVLVQIKATASSKYYDTFGADSFYLVGSDGIDDSSTTILDDTIKAAGYPPLPDADTGKTTKGWVVFTPDTGRKQLTLRYKRLAAKTSDGKKIKAKNFDIPLG